MEVQREVTSSPIWPLTRRRGAGRCERWSALPLAGLALLMAPERRGRAIGVGCHSPSSFCHHSIHSLIDLLGCDHCSLALTLQTQNENKWGVGKLYGQCECVCMYLAPMFRSVLPLLQSLAAQPKDRPGTLHPLAAERPRGWIEPYSLGYYQYSPSRQPRRQETEPLTHSAY